MIRVDQGDAVADRDEGVLAGRNDGYRTRPQCDAVTGD